MFTLEDYLTIFIGSLIAHLALQYGGGFKNWHKENLDGSLKALTELGNAS